jgi:pimeloyl-ACP methyl ester carboxylesterase
MGNASSLLSKSVFPEHIPRVDRPLSENDTFRWRSNKHLFLETSYLSPLLSTTVTCFHGNMELAAQATEKWSFLRPSHLMGFEYPGYGERSAEEASEDALLSDIPSIVEALKEEERVVVCGRSLGTFPALKLAVALGSKCVGVVLVSPMLTAIATKIPAPFFRMLAFMDLLDNEKTMRQLSENVPVFIAHGKQDSVVPVWNTHALMKTHTNTHLFILDYCSHNDVMIDGDFKKEVVSKIDSWLHALP